MHNMLPDFKNNWENDDIEGDFDEEDFHHTRSRKLLIKNESAKMHVLGCN